MPHGITSCLTLPAVMSWNASVGAARQAGQPPVRRRGDAAEDLRGFVAGLGQPVRLPEVGIADYEIPAIAALWDGRPRSPPTRARCADKDDLLEILEIAY